MAHNSALYLLAVPLIFHNAQIFVTSDSYLNHPHFANDPFHKDPVPYPEQENCDDITARKLCGSGPSEGEWAVVKVTPMCKSLVSKCDLNKNFCHPFTYVPEVCREILMQIIFYEDDHSMTLQTFAYNSRTKSTVHFADNVRLVEKYYAVYQGKPAYMEEYFDNGHHILYSPIPQFILRTEGEMFAKIGRSEENKWMIFQNCDTKVTWVVVDADTKIKDLPMYEQEYMAALRAMDIDVDCMVDVPIENASGKSFQQCMYHLDDIVGRNKLL